MKELKRLERRIRLCGCFHLAILTLIITLPTAMFIREGSGYLWLLWAFGTVIPAQGIRFVCDRFPKKPIRFLLALGILGLSVLLTLKDDYWICSLFGSLPILISGLFLPRQKGRLIFTTPNLFTLIPIFLLYALGKMAAVPIVCSIVIVLAALLVLNYFLYLSQTRLLTDISMSTDTEISVSGVIRQNRKTFAAFLIAGVLILIAVPFLLKAVQQEHVSSTVEPFEALPAVPTEPPEYELEKHYAQSPAEETMDMRKLGEALQYVYPGMLVACGLAGLGYLIFMLIIAINRRRNEEPELDDSMTVERLQTASDAQEKERLIGYEKKIRRAYERTIKARAPEKAHLAALTPTELEQKAEITGDGAETIHRIYSETRYSPAPATKERYAAFKEAVRALPAKQKTETTE